VIVKLPKETLGETEIEDLKRDVISGRRRHQKAEIAKLKADHEPEYYN
jgi:hypothetical protein